MTTHEQNLQNWVTGDAGEGEPALPTSDILTNMEQDIAQLGELTFYLGDIPEGATPRFNGVFLDYDDLYRYLDNGGLILLDENGDVIPNPIIHIYRWVDGDDGHSEYEVWMDENS